jgi:hypothetical protein
MDAHEQLTELFEEYPLHDQQSWRSTQVVVLQTISSETDAMFENSQVGFCHGSFNVSPDEILSSALCTQKTLNLPTPSFRRMPKGGQILFVKIALSGIRESRKPPDYRHL